MSQAINCSSCGAANKLPEGKDSMFCDFCGNSIIKIKQANDHADPAADPKIKNYLELAQNAMDSNDFDEAIRYFNKALENNPKISEAWFGKGYCSGWNGSLSSIRVDQMILSYNKAIEYSSEENLQDLKIKVSESIYGCAFSIYKLSYDHTVEFAQVEGTYQEHLIRSTDILAALEVAYSLNPQSKAVIESLLSISKNLLEPIKFKNYDDRWESLSLDKSSSKKIKKIYDKYFQVMEGIHPEYVNRIKNQENIIKKLKITGLVITVILLFFIFSKSCSNNHVYSDDVRDNSSEYKQDFNSENNHVVAPKPGQANSDQSIIIADDESLLPDADVPNSSMEQTNVGSQSIDNNQFENGRYQIFNLANKSNQLTVHSTINRAHDQGYEVKVENSFSFWEIKPSDDKYYYMIPNLSGSVFCLDVYMARIDNGGEVLVWKQNEGDNQKWRIVRKDDYYYIISKLSDKYLGVRENGDLFLDDLSGSDYQKWIFKPLN